MLYTKLTVPYNHLYEDTVITVSNKFADRWCLNHSLFYNLIQHIKGALFKVRLCVMTEEPCNLYAPFHVFFFMADQKNKFVNIIYHFYQ